MYCKRLRTAAHGQPGRGRAAGAPAEAARGPRGRQLLRLVNDIDWPMNRRHDYEIKRFAFSRIVLNVDPPMLAQDVVTAPIRVALPRWCREAGQCSITKGKDKFTVSFLCPCRGSSAAEMKPRKYVYVRIIKGTPVDSYPTLVSAAVVRLHGHCNELSAGMEAATEKEQKLTQQVKGLRASLKRKSDECPSTQAHPSTLHLFSTSAMFRKSRRKAPSRHARSRLLRCGSSGAQRTSRSRTASRGSTRHPSLTPCSTRSWAC